MSPDNQTVTRNTRTIIGPSFEIVRDTDDIINIDTTAGPVNITLQNIRTSGLMLNPRCIFVNDIGGNVSVNPITIFSSGGDLVNNGPFLIINTNFANAKCTIANQTEWAIAGTGVSTSGISGTGTLNRIAKFSAPTIITDSQIFDNGISVGVGTITPDVSALLDVSSTTRGVLVPRMTTAQRNLIPSPATSLLIFNLSTGFYEYFDGVYWQQIGQRNEMPLFAGQEQYLLIINFDTGSLPVGMSGSVSGAGSSVVYTQVSESGVSPGMALAAVSTTTNARVSLVTGSGYQYMRTFTDGPETTYFVQARWNGIPSPTNCVQILGWINQNAFTPLSAMGNALAIMRDPNNASGFNPGLITNLFLIARANYNGPTANTIVDLGVPYDNVNWGSFKIVYDNVLSEVRVYRNNVLLTTLTNMANVPGGSVRGVIPAAANAGLQAGFYLGNGAVAPATGTAIRIAKITVFKRYS